MRNAIKVDGRMIDEIRVLTVAATGDQSAREEVY
jgi:hypothetical protein